jgi:DNA-binding IclR family transcriptional regulator
MTTLSTRQKVLDLIAKKPSTCAEMSEIIGVAVITVRQYCRDLERAKKVYRCGRKDEGYMYTTEPTMPVDKLVIQVLKKQPMSCKALAKKVGMSRSGLGNIIRRMEEAGAVRFNRAPKPQDSKYILVNAQAWEAAKKAPVMRVMPKVNKAEFVGMFKGSPWQGMENFL